MKKRKPQNCENTQVIFQVCRHLLSLSNTIEDTSLTTLIILCSKRYAAYTQRGIMKEKS